MAFAGKRSGKSRKVAFFVADWEIQSSAPRQAGGEARGGAGARRRRLPGSGPSLGPEGAGPGRGAWPRVLGEAAARATFLCLTLSFDTFSKVCVHIGPLVEFSSVLRGGPIWTANYFFFSVRWSTAINTLARSINTHTLSYIICIKLYIRIS